ncbi:hypothetical protein QMK19_35280 [Streptomyces sp. H10-C2]|uniref:hypothetical protein n=1 Tax=unclassified Streptomyces TaxID=2593676 RepID=UPI0024B89229|nr:MULTISPECIES: hypothetical protein [unclassified Streptomyces]MDJ0345898.1 hypothetical protein [Streptomyces sp. PH10-H1]MDJ0374747.1 hypothetical protein [Streptomyces sp. H10-C2]
MSTTTHHAVPARHTISQAELSSGAEILVELSCYPDDVALQARATEQLVPLAAKLEHATGADTSVGDSDWLDLAQAVGVVLERAN